MRTLDLRNSGMSAPDEHRLTVFQSVISFTVVMASTPVMRVSENLEALSNTPSSVVMPNAFLNRA